jgi:predicted amidohydrolase YtcJ
MPQDRAQFGPDIVFTGGRIFGAPHAEGVAVRGGRIVAVGDVADVSGRSTEVVDLAGGLLLPGFQDAHVHPVQGGLERMRCDLSEESTREGCLRVIREYADQWTDRRWILGGGWAMPAFPGGTPTAADLDALVPDRPAYLLNRDHHGAWVNSRALELAGITRGTPDPPDGRIERDADGHPSGTLHEGAMGLVTRHLPPTTRTEYSAALLEAQRYLHSLGITAWQDAILGRYVGMDDVTDVYLEASRSGALTARVVGALWWERDRGTEQIRDLLERRAQGQAGRFRATSVKIMQDGVVENHTAGMLEPYLDGHGHVTGNSGLSFVDPAVLREAVTALDAAGFQVHVHAIGDRAVREALDAIEAARTANGHTDGRHHLAHIQVIHPDDVPRFGHLGVTATMQALWAANDEQMSELTLPFLSRERACWQYPFGALKRSGALLAAGSDWPVSTPDPLAAIQVAVTRRQPDAEAEAFLRDQALTQAEAFTAYTAGSAYVNHLDETGVVEVGRLADLVVLDRDPLSGEPEAITDAHVVATYVEGECVFSA